MKKKQCNSRIFTGEDGEERFAELQNKIHRLELECALYNEFSELRYGSILDRMKVYFTKEVNEYARKAMFVHMCTCCADSSLYLLPYNDDLGAVKVFTYPPSIVIGYRNKGGYGDVIDLDSCEQTLKRYGICDPEIMNLVRIYSSINPPMELCTSTETLDET